MSFCVVHFVKTSEVDFVPKLWINETETKCRYPKKKLPDFEDLKRDPECAPQNSWPKYKIKLIKHYCTAADAERGVTKYLETSDIESSEAEGHRSIVTTPHLVEVPNTHDPIQTVDAQSVSIINQPVQSTSSNIICSEAESFQVVSSNASQIFVEPSYSFVAHPNPQPLSTFNASTTPATNSNELLLQILENQKILEQQINDIKKLLLPVLASNSNASTNDQFAPVPFIPISNTSDLESIEEWLKHPENFKKLVIALSKIGGHEISLTTYAVLNYIFLHQFALQIRLTPKSGKIGIASTKVLEVVRETVRHSFPQATDKVINIYVGSWFRTSGDRKGGRKRRNNGDTQKNTKTPRVEGGTKGSERIETTENQSDRNDETPA